MIVKKSIKKITLSLLLINSLAFGASNLDSGVQELGKEISKSMINKKKTKLAIIEFSDLRDNVNDLGRYLAEKLISELFKLNSDGFSIIERRQLAKVLREQKLSSSGLIDGKAMKKVGNLLGVDAIVTGSVTDLGNVVEINARVISVETGDVIGSASTQIPKVGNVANLLSSNIQQSVGSSNASATTTQKKALTKSSTNSMPLKFSNRYVNILVEKIKKNGDEISMSVSMENRTDTTIRLSVNKKNSSVVNEKEQIWYNMDNTLFTHLNQLDINAKSKKVSKMTFISDGATEGKRFNLNIEFNIPVINGRHVKIPPFKLFFEGIKF